MTERTPSSVWKRLVQRWTKSRRQTLRRRSLGCVESLELRLALAGINGPHAADPAYNPQQSFHIHAGLTMYVNSQKVTVPIFNPTPADIHTHDTSGAIHIHPSTGRTGFVTMKDVFDAWRNATDSGKNPNAVLTSTNLLNNQVDTEHSLRMFVNGVETDAFENYQIHDRDQILLVYGSNPVVTLSTNQGPIVVELLEDVTPNTVSNFLTYANSGSYNNAIFHRHVPNFVIQGGGFKTTSTTFSSASQLTNIPTNASIANEFDNWAVASGTGAAVVQGNATIQLNAGADLSRVSAGQRIRLTGRDDGLSDSNMFDIVSVNNTAKTVTVSQVPTDASTSNVAWAIFPRVNVTNTIAMAKLGGDPNSATNQFFINLSNNDSNLDLQNGGFTVFARVLEVSQPQTTDSSTPANQLLNGSYTAFVNNLTRTNAGGAFTDLPLAANSQLVTIQSVLGEGEVKGVVYNDLDGSGTRSSGEAGRAGVVVYSDANNNQQRDANEEATTTDANGGYALRLAPGPHRIRMVGVNATTQSTPQDGYSVTVQIGREITARDFGLLSLAAPTAVDLVAATDSGSSSTDNVTNFNNSTAAKAPQFQVSGVLAGATVQVLSDGVVIGQTTVPAGSTGTVTVTANGTTTIADGNRIITASQTLNGASGAMAAANGLSVRIDATGPQFTSTPPLTAQVGVALSYNAETNEESSGVTYALQSSPAGVSILGSTGAVSWTPTAAQLGPAQFTITATDTAGNVSSQAVSLTVTKAPQVRVRLAVTDLNGNALSTINVGDTFQLRGFVSDVRGTPTGARAIYQDITWNGTVASVVPGTLTFGANYNQNTAGTASAGLLDEVGGTTASTTALGGTEQPFFQVNLRANAAGSLSFVGDAPDVTPAHQITLIGGTTAVPADEIDFGRTAPIQVRQVAPGSLAGFVYVDANNNGIKEAGEQPMASVTVTLTGTDSFGAAVSRTATTATDGSYKFDNLNPGSYKLKQTQPTGQLNNLPILDGKETVGSQGGTVSGNDEFTITLAEGVNGTGNNFAELVGHTLAGTAKVDESPQSNDPVTGSPLAITGVQVQLFAADAQNRPTGSPIQTTQINSNGTYQFAGLTTGTYVATSTAPIFLTGTQSQVVQVGNGSAATPIQVPVTRAAKYISYRDFMNSTPRQGVFAAVTPGGTNSVWTAFDASWSSVSNLSVKLTSDGQRLRIEATSANGTAVFDEISVSDPRVRTVAQEGNTKLYRLAGRIEDYQLRPVAGSTSSATASSLRLADGAESTASDTAGEAQDSQLADDGHGEHSHGEGEAAPSWMPDLMSSTSAAVHRPSVGSVAGASMAAPAPLDSPAAVSPISDPAGAPVLEPATGAGVTWIVAPQVGDLETLAGTSLASERSASTETGLEPAAIELALSEAWDNAELDETVDAMVTEEAEESLLEALAALSADDPAISIL